MQKAVTQFSSPCGKVNMFVDNDLAIGVFHDYLMEIKGLMVDRMIAAHKEQIEQASAQKLQDPEAQDSCSSQQCA